jgi:uncharacterized protein YfaP (DUF2135 family)
MVSYLTKKISTMKRLILALVVLPLIFMSVSCSKDDKKEEPVLVGQDGNPRFNLVFNNHENVDLDLHVKTPAGTVIYYGNPSAEGGTLDVDCLCSSCPQGPNENIFWDNGTAPAGTYEYWVNYYGSCGTSGSSSDFTVRVIRNGTVLVTRTGTLTSGTSTVWTHVQ